ncbi:MAG: hypothetical protein M1434_01620 [Chloroflexi bacterium]|nr:hypothetical protein [Chloroflexota bacterium]MCL5273427.1 hypothetical protein [Chloroflexota bacterium]
MNVHRASVTNVRVSDYRCAADIDRLLDPHQYTGLSAVFVDRVLDD